MPTRRHWETRRSPVTTVHAYCCYIIVDKWNCSLDFKPHAPCTLVLCLKSNECHFEVVFRCSSREEKKTSPAAEEAIKVLLYHSKRCAGGTVVVVPENTHRATQWSLHVFQTWQSQRNETFPEEQCPEDILQTDNADTLSYWL